MCLPSKLRAASIQEIATIVGNILCLNFGLMFGTSVVHIQQYQTFHTELNRPINKNVATWITSCLFLGAALGSLQVGSITRKIGPKSVLMLCGLLQIIAWFCIHFAYDILHIYSSRTFAGLAAGAAFTILPAYIAEISEEENRTHLVLSINQWRTAGILFGFALAVYLPYTYVIIVGLGVSMFFTLTFPFVQESPYYFMHKSNVSSLEKSLRWFRGIRHIDDRKKPEFLRELQEFKSEIKNPSLADCEMSLTYLFKTKFICLYLTFAAQMTGDYIILLHGNDVFLKNIALLKFEYIVIILTALQFIGATIASLIGSRMRRKLLLCYTGLLSGLALTVFAVVNACISQMEEIPVSWLRFGLLAVHLFSANVGIYSLSNVILIELLPLKLRIPTLSMSIGFSWFILFLLIQFFDFFIENIGLVGLVSTLAGCSIILAAFAIILLPETYGRSLKEVQILMGNEDNGDVAKISTISNGHITCTEGHI